MNKLLLLIPLMLLFFSCSKDEKKSSPLIEGNFEKNEKTIEEKKAKGDTLAMPFQSLEKFIPSSINGYAAEGNVSGETKNESGMSWSVIRKTYQKGNQRITISLADYNGAYGLYAGATAVFSLGKVENEEEKSQPVDFKNGQLNGWESYKKLSKEAFLIVAINERFLLTIEAEGQGNTDLIRLLVENSDLDALMEF